MVINEFITIKMIDVSKGMMDSSSRGGQKFIGGITVRTAKIGKKMTEVGIEH